ncbi:MAG: family 1 glycosylhydrolase [Clostridiales bacterium]|nr:family 1 glycosylhydrolase [Clostridiales bacterium]
MAACIAEDIPVKGHLNWSLLDNFEWQKDCGMTFGLIAVERKNQMRIIKSSLAYLGSRKELFRGLWDCLICERKTKGTTKSSFQED